MPSHGEIEAAMVTALKRRKILTIGELCSIAQRTPLTVWRTLKCIGYYTSFNHNAGYYTLAETPRFDADGLWFYRDVGFSSHGSLTRTLVGLTERSPMGMTPNELSALLHVRVQNQLFHLFAQQKLGRFSWGKGHAYVSLSEEVQREQIRRRRATEASALPTESPLSNRETISILAELVRAPRSSARRIATILSARGVAVTRQKVLEVIERYELPKKGASRRWRS